MHSRTTGFVCDAAPNPIAGECTNAACSIRFRQIAHKRVPGFSGYFAQMAACPRCYHPIVRKAALFESDYICANCKQRLGPELSSVLLSVLLLLGIPSGTIGLFALILGIDGSAMMIGFFVLLPFGICAGGTVICYEARPEEPVEVPILRGGPSRPLRKTSKRLTIREQRDPAFWRKVYPGKSL
jgi:hypothetical protein